MTLAIGGLATGIDSTTLIQQIMAAEKRPVTTLETHRLKAQALSTSFKDLGNKLGTLKTLADALDDPETFYSRSVSSSDATVATASASSGSLRGTFNLTTTALARGSVAAAGTTRNALTALAGSGDSTLAFRVGASGSLVSIDVGATMTMAQLVTAINDEHAGVRASAVNVGTDAAPAYQLTLVSTGTGLENDITMVTDTTGLGVVRTQAALDAAFVVAGLGSFTRSTNTFSDVIEGVTVTLKAASGDTDLVVDYDKGGTQQRLQGLLDAYNDVVRTIDTQTAVTTTNGVTTAGAFTGDPVPRDMRRRLAAQIATDMGGTIGTLAAIGVTTEKDGTLTLDSALFQKLITSDPDSVKAVVAGTSSSDGVAALLSSVTNAYTQSSSGTIAVRQQSLATAIKTLESQIDAAQSRLDATELRLRVQFANLEQIVSRLQASGASLLNNLANMNDIGNK